MTIFLLRLRRKLQETANREADDTRRDALASAAAVLDAVLWRRRRTQ